MIKHCPAELLYTYEALSQFPFCNIEEKKLLSKLHNCTNVSCVKDVICQEVRQEHCTFEWRMLELNESKELIDCSDYGETAPLECSSQFDLAHNGSVCLPLCKEFSQYDNTFTTFFTTWIAVFNGVNVIGGIICLVVSVYRIKKL